MACGCGGNGQNAKNVGLMIVKFLFCTKTNQCFIKGAIGTILPILFWLGVIGAFALSCKIAGTMDFRGGFDFGWFFTSLIILLPIVLLFFYVVYILKEIKDGVSSSCECCECEEETEDSCCASKAEETEVEEKAPPKKRVKKTVE